MIVPEVRTTAPVGSMITWVESRIASVGRIIVPVESIMDPDGHRNSLFLSYLRRFRVFYGFGGGGVGPPGGVSVPPLP